MTQDESMREARSLLNEASGYGSEYTKDIENRIASALRRKNEMIAYLEKIKCGPLFTVESVKDDEIAQLKDRIKELEEDGNLLRKVHQEDWFDKTKMMRVFNDECKKYKSEIQSLKDSLQKEKEKLAQWMLSMTFATGHGDTMEDLLKELTWQVDKIKDSLQKSTEHIEELIEDNAGLKTSLRIAEEALDIIFRNEPLGCSHLNFTTIKGIANEALQRIRQK